jgi:hypothetical protein
LSPAHAFSHGVSRTGFPRTVPSFTSGTICRVSGFVISPQTRRVNQAESSSYPTDCHFASPCSPPRLLATQLGSATYCPCSYGADLHRSV